VSCSASFNTKTKDIVDFDQDSDEDTPEEDSEDETDEDAADML
jgi:hypothetical protein